MIQQNITKALAVLTAVGVPRAQLNQRSALTLLALAGIDAGATFKDAASPLMGITPIMDWVQREYQISYAPNTREMFRRQTMHQFVAAGIAAYNPDNPSRPVNSPKAVYQLTAEFLRLIRDYDTPRWLASLADYNAVREGLAARYARARDMAMVPLELPNGEMLRMSPGAHSELIRAVVEEFAPRFAPGSTLIYAGDTGEKLGFFDKGRLEHLGVSVDDHGKLPDVVLHFGERDWLILIEAVTSHGPVDPKRHDELVKLFADCTVGLVFVTAFPTRAAMARYVPEIAWETEVWVADAPTHLIHFNGVRFLGPYARS